MSTEPTKRNSVLFLTDCWSPIATANAVCVRNVAEIFLDDGWDVYVSAITNGKETQTKIGNINISTIKPTIDKQLLHQSKMCSSKLFAAGMKILAKSFYWVKRLFFLPIYPVGSPLYARKWSRKIDSLIRIHQIDLLISVDAPEETVYTGYYVKRNNPDVKWAVYYIDSGTNVLRGASFEKAKHLLRKKAIGWENTAFQYAEKILVMKGHAAYYRTNLSVANQCKLEIVDVPLFSNPAGDSNATSRKQTLKWVYVGNMTKRYYAPQIICDLFIAYNKRHSRATLDLYGPTDVPRYLEEMSESVRNGICWHGTVSHDEIGDILSHADVLVYYKSERLDSVSGKFFEYISTRKPVIYIGHQADINSVLVQKYIFGLTLNIEEPHDVNVDHIDAFFDRLQNILPPSVEQLKDQFRLSRPETTAHYMEGIIG